MNLWSAQSSPGSSRVAHGEDGRGLEPDRRLDCDRRLELGEGGSRALSLRPTGGSKSNGTSSTEAESVAAKFFFGSIVVTKGLNYRLALEQNGRGRGQVDRHRSMTLFSKRSRKWSATLNMTM